MIVQTRDAVGTRISLGDVMTKFDVPIPVPVQARAERDPDASRASVSSTRR